MFYNTHVMFDKNYTYIVTGASGYVGNCIAKKLMEQGLDVIGLVRNKEKVEKVFKGNYPTLVYGDIRDKECVEKLFIGDKPFIIFHTAALISIGEEKEKELYDVNVNGTINMLESAKNHNTHKFFHISSSEAIPENIKLNKDISNYIPNPKKVRKGYNRTKSQADVEVLRYFKEYGLDVNILIISGVLGPGDYSLSHMSQLMIDYAKGNLPASIKGGYNDFDIRDFIYVLDNIISNSKKGETYLFANREDEINEVLSYVGEYKNLKPLMTLPIWLAYVGLPFLHLGQLLTGKRPLYTASSLASIQADVDYDISKVKEQFSYHPRSLKETVIDHFKFLEDEGYLS